MMSRIARRVSRTNSAAASVSGKADLIARGGASGVTAATFRFSIGSGAAIFVLQKQKAPRGLPPGASNLVACTRLLAMHALRSRPGLPGKIKVREPQDGRHA